MRVWQPIETAPKDGSMILTFNVAHGDMHVVGWTRSYSNVEPYDEDHWSDVGGQNRAPALFFNSGYFQFWMPLPNPPVQP